MLLRRAVAAAAVAFALVVAVLFWRIDPLAAAAWLSVLVLVTAV